MSLATSNPPQNKPAISRQSSISSHNAKLPNLNSQRSTSKPPNRDPSSAVVAQEDDPTWGSNFWVTLVDPKVVFF